MGIDTTKLAIAVLDGALTFEGIPAELHGRIVVALELLDSTNDESFEAAIKSAYEYIGKDDKDLDSIAQLLDEFKQRATK